MKTAIDTYCYHRFFGEVYPQQPTPVKRMTLEDLLRRAHELDVGGVSLESCFIPRMDTEYLARIRGLLDEYSLERVFAWGHPDGLEGGTNQTHLRQSAPIFFDKWLIRRGGKCSGLKS